MPAKLSPWYPPLSLHCMLRVSPHLEAILLQVCCTFCWLAQWDVIAELKGDIIQLCSYLDRCLRWGAYYIPIIFCIFFFFSLRDSKKSQNNFLKLAMVHWLPFLLRAFFVVWLHGQGWKKLWLIIPSNTLFCGNCQLNQMIDATVYPCLFDIYIKFRYIWYKANNESPFNTWL